MLASKEGSMAPRPKCRRIAHEPPAAAFKPAGIPGRDLETTVLQLDEMEALRLADLEGLYQDEAARRMRISRATFGRVVEEARRKVVEALLESRMLVFEGGPVEMAAMRVFHCEDCGADFEVPFGTGRPAECPHCHGRQFYRADGVSAGRRRRSRRGRCETGGRRARQGTVRERAGGRGPRTVAM
jgi:predicted DNA-binding protein (UPF0251 family)